jgi:starch synthase
MSERLRILFVSAEVAPFAKVGGLADVAGALPKALAALGHDVRVIMPSYGRIDEAKCAIAPVLEEYPVPVEGRSEKAALKSATIGQGVPAYMVESDKYFAREAIYGYPDDGERFIFFCRAALEAARALDWPPDIVHCNDWHTAIIPNWLKTIYDGDPFFTRTASVFTIHNLAYQGIFDPRILAVAGLGSTGFLQPQLAVGGGQVDLMSQGILYADALNTVSETYAREILTPDFGEGLDSVLRYRKGRLFGILNGIDHEQYNPATDPNIAQHYDVSTLDKKVENRLALQKECGLKVDAEIPLIGVVSRLADQKGFDLLEPIIDPLMTELEVQFVLLGTGDQHYHEVFRRMAEKYPSKASVFLTFNAALAQRIYAGCDMFLMPSRFEPCGLGQLIALRYGAIPIVRSTGGLADTVDEIQPGGETGNGFAFTNYNPYALLVAIVRAVETFKHKNVWRRLMKRAMEADFSWARSAKKYVELYRKALEWRLES